MSDLSSVAVKRGSCLRECKETEFHSGEQFSVLHNKEFGGIKVPQRD
jgi:hypothetical protein